MQLKLRGIRRNVGNMRTFKKPNVRLIKIQNTTFPLLMNIKEYKYQQNVELHILKRLETLRARQRQSSNYFISTSATIVDRLI